MSSSKFQDLSTGSKSLVLIEFFYFACAFLLSVFFNNYFESQFSIAIKADELFIYAMIFTLTTQLSSLSLGLYNSKLRENTLGLFPRVLVSVGTSFFIMVLINPLFKEQAFPLELIAQASLLCFLFAMLFRYCISYFDFFGLNKRKVLVLGTGKRADIIEKRMRRDVDRQGFTLQGFVHMGGDVQEGIESELCIELKESLATYVIEHKIDEIVVANDERRDNLPVDELFTCKIRGVEITEILDFIERETGQIAVHLIYPSWIIYSNGFASSNHLRNRLDWFFNASIAFFMFMLFWPIMLITAVLIKLEDGLSAPVFYFQERVGLDGHSFRIYKFRSMRIDAEKDGIKMADKDDDRTTKIGKYIRKYRVDELPQIYNVMKGDMGFVGPRPERPEFVQNLIKVIPYYNERHNVKPGLTGWAQLKYPYGTTQEDSMEKLKFDLYYIKHRNFILDLLILLRTVEIVLFGKGR